MISTAVHPIICVVDWGVTGHHDVFLRLYTRALLRSGWAVVVISPAPEGLANWWRTEAGLNESALSRTFVEKIPLVDFSLTRTRWKHGWRRWRWGAQLSRCLRRGERKLDGRAQAVFFSCLYEHEVSLAYLAAQALGRPWSGLYLQASAYRQPGLSPRINRHYPIQRLWRHPGLFGLLTLDEGIVEQVAADCGQPVWVAPDLTDGTTDGEDELAARVRAFRGARMLTGICGHLLPSKGVATLARAALAAERTGLPLCFVFAGKIEWKLFTPEEAEILRAAFALSDRVLVYDLRISSEGAYNRILAACDILCAVYLKFPHSSNTLTKAATLEKPVIVSEGHLMAKRTRAYRLGEVVTENDADALLEAIGRIAADPPGWRVAMAPLWREYREAHSEARLEAVLQELLDVLRNHRLGISKK